MILGIVGVSVQLGKGEQKESWSVCREQVMSCLELEGNISPGCASMCYHKWKRVSIPAVSAPDEPEGKHQACLQYWADLVCLFLAFGALQTNPWYESLRVLVLRFILLFCFCFCYSNIILLLLWLLSAEHQAWFWLLLLRITLLYVHLSAVISPWAKSLQLPFHSKK